jgi:mRNA-degrading endonuclease YafQ of YafQ-DinJ toxin-antitoxin module
MTNQGSSAKIRRMEHNHNQMELEDLANNQEKETNNKDHKLSGLTENLVCI